MEAITRKPADRLQHHPTPSHSLWSTWRLPLVLLLLSSLCLTLEAASEGQQSKQKKMDSSAQTPTKNNQQGISPTKASRPNTELKESRKQLDGQNRQLDGQKESLGKLDDRNQELATVKSEQPKQKKMDSSAQTPTKNNQQGISPTKASGINTELKESRKQLDGQNRQLDGQKETLGKLDDRNQELATVKSELQTLRESQLTSKDLQEAINKLKDDLQEANDKLTKDFQAENWILKMGTNDMMHWGAIGAIGFIIVGVVVLVVCLIFVFPKLKKIGEECEVVKENVNKLESLEAELSALQDKGLKEMKEMISAEQTSEINKKDKIISDLKKQIETLAKSVNENLGNNIRTINDEVKEIRNVKVKLDNLDKGESQWGKSLAEGINKEISKLKDCNQNLIDCMKTERQEAEEKLRKANELNEQCQQKKKELEQEKKKLQQSIDTQVEARTKDLQKQLTEAGKQLTEERKQIEALVKQGIIERLSNILKDVHSTHEAELKEKVESLTKEVSQMSNQLTSEQTLKEGALRKNGEYKDEISNLKGNLLDKNNELECQGKELADTKSTLETVEKEQEELKKQLDKQSETIAKHDEEVTKLKRSHAEELQRREQEQAAKLASVESEVLPRGLQDLPEFAPLRDQLRDWLRQQPKTAEIIRSSLGQFASRQLLDQDTLDLSLRNLSVGLSKTMRALGRSPVEALDVLVTWRDFLQKCAEGSDISLQLPNINDSVDSSWMTPMKPSVRKVSWIVSWAVSSRKYGVRHNAVVE